MAALSCQLIQISLSPFLTQVGYTRQLQLEDVWQLDEDRLVAHRGKILQEKFYMRCPVDLRPHYLRPDAIVGECRQTHHWCCRLADVLSRSL